MEHAGFIFARYIAAFGGSAGLVWYVIRRGRTLGRQLPDEDKPWI